MPQARTPLALTDLEARTVRASFLVTTTVDTLDPSDGALSLREAVRAANATPEADTITVPAGTYSLTLTGAAEDAALTGDLDVTGSVTVTGAGLAATAVDGLQADRVFDLHGGTVTLAALTVRNGRVTDANGGGVRSTAVLTLDGVAVVGCQAVGVTPESTSAAYQFGRYVYGGGVAQEGNPLAVAGSRFADDAARGGPAAATGTAIAFGGRAFGGAVSVYNGSAAFANTTFEGNEAAGGAATADQYAGAGGASGGAIHYYGYEDGYGGVDATLTLAGCTVVGNRAVSGAATAATPSLAAGFGGGVYAHADATAVSSTTFTGNVAADGFGGGLYANGYTGPVTLHQTTLDGNTAAKGGGAYISNDGSAAITYGGTLVHCTVVGNTAAAGQVGGVSGPVTVRASVVAGNAGGDLSGGTSGAVSGGGNVIGVSPGAAFVNGVNGDAVGSAAAPLDAKLGPLTDNGGPTPTRLPLAGSPAVDRGAATVAFATDQRGPGYARVVGPAADAGAVERQAAPAVAAVVVNGGQPQRSFVTTLAVTFDGPVTLAAGAFAVTGPAAVTVTFASQFVAGRTVATLSFSGPGTVGGSLADGTWALAVDRTKVTRDGQMMAADYAQGGILRYLSDFDGDGAVDGNDLAALAQAFNAVVGDANYRWWLDLDGDGAVDGNDLAVLAQRFNTVL